MKEGYKKTELGWIPEEWQIKKLGDIFEFNGGMSISREKLVDEGVNYLHYGDIHKRNKNYIDVTVDKTWLPKIQDDFNSIKDTVKLTDGDVCVKFLWVKIKEYILNNSRISSQTYKSLLQ